MSVDNDVKILFDEVKVKDKVNIPITKTLQESVKKHFDDFAVVSNNIANNVNEPARRVDVFSQGNVKDVFTQNKTYNFIEPKATTPAMSIIDAKKFILKNMWKTQIAGNKFRDEYGRINCFEYASFSSL